MMRMTRELPLAQPGSRTISWMMAAIFGVRWLRPASLTIPQYTGLHPTEAVVFVLDEMLPLVELKVAGLALAWPWMASVVVSVQVVSSVENWM